MDKILIITEKRPPKKGERFISKDFYPHINMADCDYRPSEDRYIITAEIEVPVDAETLCYYFWIKTDNCMPRQATSLCFIPLAKPKIKRWLWERPHALIRGLVIRTAKPMTESEVNALDITSHGWRKVEGSEIEL